MNNFKQFYNAWTSFAKPKRELLLEEENNDSIVQASSYNFLKLTVPPGDLQRILKVPDEKEKQDILKSKSEDFDIQRRALRLFPFSKEQIQKDLPVLVLEPRKFNEYYQAPVYQVVEHHGRARNLANIYTNKIDATLPLKIIVKDGKKLENIINLLIQGQNAPGADSEYISLKDLIPSLKTEVKAKELLDSELKNLKSEVAGGKTFNVVIRQSSIPGRTIVDPMTPEIKVSGIVQKPSLFKAFKKLEVSSGKYDYQILSGDDVSVAGQNLRDIRNKFVDLLNSNFQVKNDKGQEFIFINNILPGGGQTFVLRKPGEENKPESDEDKKEKYTLTISAK